MNWIEGINEAIKYIEANLTNDLKMEEIAERAYASVAYFQKSFVLLCGFTVGEYIRNRRLASAGNDLLTTDEKVIDIALKYGYDSTDSFTKAFTRFHGATPTAVRKGGHSVKTFAPLKLELFMKGGFIMDYRIQKQESFPTFFYDKCRDSPGSDIRSCNCKNNVCICFGSICNKDFSTV